MNLAVRSYKKELLDGSNIPFADIRQNMHELNIINTWLGGHSITLQGFHKLLDGRKRVSICEIGCGGGDNLLHLHNWCVKNNIEATLTGVDYNHDCIRVAREKLPAASARFITADYRNCNFTEDRPDILFSSLFCHHFTDEELVSMLRWMRQNAAGGFFINDLHRHFLAYYSIKILTRLFSKSYLVRNDAPLSVERGFAKREWEQLLSVAGINAYSIEWKWAFRWLISCRTA